MIATMLCLKTIMDVKKPKEVKSDTSDISNLQNKIVSFITIDARRYLSVTPTR